MLPILKWLIQLRFGLDLYQELKVLKVLRGLQELRVMLVSQVPKVLKEM